MKHSATLLALTLSSSLIADSCCQPCCVPNPRAPICTEAYTPAFDDMQCDWDVFVDAEFLYWYAGERDLFYAVKEETQEGEVSTGSGVTNVQFFAAAPVEYKHFSTKWDPGFRLGLGMKMCDGWDLSLFWTYYKNDKKNSTSVSSLPSTQAFPGVGGFSLMAPFVNQYFVFAPFDSISGKWNFKIDQIDLELGRKYYLSKCFVMRPYVGLRGAWSKTNFAVISRNSNSPSNIANGVSVPFPNPYIDRFHNHNWGVGLLGGLQPSWYFTEEFSLFGNLEAALLWGQFKEKNSKNYKGALINTGFVTNVDYNNSCKSNYTGMQPVVDLALGLRWETNWCENRYAFALDAGWEHHIWFNYNNRPSHTGALSSPIKAPSAIALFSDTAFSENSNDVYFGGFVLRARFDF